MRMAACGWSYSVCVLEDGAVLTWGAAACGQLGHPQRLRQRSPKVVEALAGERVVMAACGENHSVALTDSGSVYAWGSGANGRLGIGDGSGDSGGVGGSGGGGGGGGEAPAQMSTPTRVDFTDGDDDARVVRMAHISCGYNHTGACDVHGNVYTWGKGSNGVLGHGETRDELWPRRVEAASMASERIVQVSCGYKHTAVTAESGALFVWGCKDNGRLGGADRPAGSAAGGGADCVGAM